jgi:hypothetical protein
MPRTPTTPSTPSLIPPLLLLASFLLVTRALQPVASSSRRQVLERFTAPGLLSLCTIIASPEIASAAAEEEFVSMAVAPFSFEIPKSWKVIVKPNSTPKDGKLFSALDLGTGAVLTIVQEQICSRAEYALNDKQCDLVAGESPTFGPETFSKDVTKLLRRHDDRDNVALQGISTLDRVQVQSGETFQVFSTTTIPTGGTYQDRMGLDQPYVLTRTVQSQVRVDNPSSRVYSLWLSAPTDEWRKPIVGTRILQVWTSVKCI